MKIGAATHRQTKFFLLARMMSQHSNYRFQIGAVITYKGRIISTGFNKPTKTHPKSNHPFHTIHAELDAIHSSVQFISARLYCVLKNI